MRMYLSFYQVGAHPEVLRGMVRGRRQGWMIANALDGHDENRRKADTKRQVASLAALGLHAADLDLRVFNPLTIQPLFGHPDFVWVRGGNVFSLRTALARSRLDQVIIDGLAADRFVCAGFSACPCVLAPSLSGLELCDPSEACQATYQRVRYDGLGVLDRPVVPHLDSPEHPETALPSQVAEKYTAEGRPFWSLSDGQALVIDGSATNIRRGIRQR